MKRPAARTTGMLASRSLSPCSPWRRWIPFDLSKIPSQSTNPNGVCYVVAPVVAPVVLGSVKAAPAAQAAPTVTTLAFTGAEPVPLSLLALLALVLGAALTVAGRRQGSQGARG